MKTCKECGNELEATSKFCENCGTKVDSASKISVQQDGENIAVPEIERTEENTSEISTQNIERYLIGYLDFIKKSLLAPTSIFSEENERWIFGLINLILYSIVLAITSYENFFTVFLQMLVLQAAFVGVLFVVNKFIVQGTDDFLDALGKYGGLISGQIILFALIILVGADSGFGGFLSLIAFINQLLLFNIYIFESQTDKEQKVDHYYQLIISYIPLILIMTFMFNQILS